MGKTQMQIEIQKLDQFIEDHCEFDQIYIETQDPETKDPIATLIDRKKLVQILVIDMTVDWALLIANWRTKLVPYLKNSLQVDTSELKLDVRNKNDISNLIVAHC